MRIMILIIFFTSLYCSISHRNSVKKSVRDIVITNIFQKSICFKYSVFGISCRLLWNRVYKQSCDVRTSMILVVKCILSSRNNGMIVVIIIKNDGMYALMNKLDGFLCNVNATSTLIPSDSFRPKWGFTKLNCCNTFFPE